MLSNIQTWTSSVEQMEISYLDGTAVKIIGDIYMLIKNKRIDDATIVITQREHFTQHKTDVIISGDYLVIKKEVGKIRQFFPHDIYRCMIKDFNKDRSFDISYRKHIFYDYSKEHFNLVVPYEVDDSVRERAIEYVQVHSTGKQNKPTGIVLDDIVIVVKGDNNFTYTI